MNYVESSKRFGAKIGDKVTVFQKAIGRERGWQNCWVDEMDVRIGQTGIVVDQFTKKEDLNLFGTYYVDDGHGIMIKFDGQCKSELYYYPWFCLNFVR